MLNRPTCCSLVLRDEGLCKYHEIADLELYLVCDCMIFDVVALFIFLGIFLVFFTKVPYTSIT